MRLPVTRSRRCEQMTALGASEVPDVKISAQIESMSGSSPGSAAEAGSVSGQQGAERRRRVVGVDEASRHEHRRQFGCDRGEQRLVARFGDHEGAVGVLDVPQEVLAAPGVVQPDDRRAQQRRATQCEEIVRRVVEQHRDVPRSGCRQPFGEQGREPARLLVVLAVGPGFGAELDRNAVVVLGGIAAQERGRIRSHQRRLPGRRYRARAQVRHRADPRAGRAPRAL